MAAGCASAPINPVVTVNPTPTVSVNSPTICAGGSAVLTATPSIGGGTFSWSPGGQTTSSISVSPGTTTTYTCSYTKSGCTGMGFGTVTVNPLPSPSASNNGPVCVGSTLSLTAATLPGATYSWSGPSAYGATMQNPTIPGVTLANGGTYTLTATVGGCSNSTTTNVIINSLPTVNAGIDQTVCVGNVVTFSASAPGAIAYSWTFGDGNTSTVLNPTHTYVPAGTYTATLTVTGSTGCTNSDMVQITVAPTPTLTPTSIDVTCFGACDGTAAVSAAGGFAPITYLWTPGGQTTSSVSGLCAGSYTVSVTNNAGCGSTLAYTIAQPAAFAVTAGIDQNICLGDTTTLVGTATGGVLPYTYNWNDGTTGYPVQTLLTSPLLTTTYTLTATDAIGCIANDNMSVTVLPNTNIYGHVTYSGGSITTGTSTAVLFSYVPFMTSFDTVTTASIDAGGNYYFPSVAQGDYLIKVFTDTAAYPLLIATYFGDEYLWDSATVVSHDCSANSVANIAMIEVPAISGPGHIDGVVTEGDGFGRAPGDPIPGVDIKLGRNPGGQLVSSTQTDASGQYTFDNVPSSIAGENYVIYVDIPGLERITLYSFVVDPITQYYDMDYEADSSTVYTTQTSVGINNSSKTDNGFRIFPNPAKENVTVKYTLKEDAKVSISIYNLLGVKVSTPFSGSQPAGEFTFSVNNGEHKLGAGVYFITLTRGNVSSVQRLVIAE